MPLKSQGGAGLDYHLESKVVLNDQPQHPNLYKWSLSEVGEPPCRLRSDQIPWDWSLYFMLSDIELHAEVDLDPYSVPDSEKARVVSRDSIRANLRPGRRGTDDRITYSMFGTERRIEDFTLTVRPTPEDVEEHCRAWGLVSYTTEHDFRDVTMDDCVGFELYLSPERFAHMADRMASRAVGGGVLRVQDVSGFYSDWSPSISTSHVKVLTDEAAHPLEIPEGCEIVPPRMQTVAEFDLSLWSVAIRPTTKAADAVDEDDDDPRDHRGQDVSKPALNLLPVLKSLRLAAWLIVGLLVLLFFK